MKVSIIETSNFARTSRIIIDLCREVLHDILAAIVSPAAFLPTTFIKTLPRNKKLNPSQEAILHRVPTNGSYEECNISLLYMLIGNSSTSHKLTNGYGKHITPENVNVSDDIEHIRELRNHNAGT